MAPSVVMVQPVFLEKNMNSALASAELLLANKTVYVMSKANFDKTALDKIVESNLDKNGRITQKLQGNSEYYFYVSGKKIDKAKITKDYFEGPVKLTDKLEQQITLAPKIFVIWFGGPGKFDPKDKEHDGNWANYLLPMLKWGANNLFNASENVFWYIYKKAYTDRWADDIKNGDAIRKEHAAKGKGIIADNYVSHIEEKVKGYNTKRSKYYPIQLQWMNNEAHFWTAIKQLPDKSIIKVWYFGHGKDDLWLNLTHNSEHVACSPAKSEIIKISDISANDLKKKFYQKLFSKESKNFCSFYGCNTIEFAKQWKLSYNVPAWGMDGRIDFSLSDYPTTKLDTILETLQTESSGKWREADEI